MPKVTIIIVNYNGEGLLGECLRSTGKQLFRDYDLVIIDNNSHDDSREKIEDYLMESGLAKVTTVAKLDANAGFSGGNIRGVEVSSGEYIATLNNDTEVEETWLGELAQLMEQDSTIGICSSKLITYGTQNIDSSGDGFSKALKGFKIGEGEELAHYDHKEYVFGACAGAALYRREMLDEVGFFDEDFFLIHEDTDLNLRAQLAGWKVVYVPTAVVNHKVRSSIGTMSETAVYYSLRNSEWVKIKNVPLGVFLVCLPEFFMGVLSEFFYFAIKHRFLKLYFLAKWDALKGFPKMYRKRKEIMKLKRVSNRYLLSMMTPVWNKEFFLSKLRKFIHD